MPAEGHTSSQLQGVKRDAVEPTYAFSLMYFHDIPAVIDPRVSL